MRKKLLMMITIGLLAILATACNSVTKELVDYWNEHYIVHYADPMEEFFNDVNEFANAELMDEESEMAAVHALQKQHEDIIAALKDIEIKNEETQEVHDMLLSLNEHRTKGLTSLEEAMTALFADDWDTYIERWTEFEDSFIKADEEEEKYLERWEELDEEFNIEVEER
ncbi:hypothetical protein SAMN05421736_101322 [Evansella caseinilytica]|uniref:Lipoprotein n=1 Tax=Evansella caseinilytica TaxID=1503961 RepID=A0A1H3GYF3_9BACI|nr:hypothetical protein [Evansella caseinilytica]SDY08336.1 hypothetical protein SAMN05421736_101322 [Evansella caseinilytica]